MRVTHFVSHVYSYTLVRNSTFIPYSKHLSQTHTHTLRMVKLWCCQLFRLKSNENNNSIENNRKKVLYSPFQQPAPLPPLPSSHTHKCCATPTTTLIESQSTFLHLIFKFVFPLGEFFSLFHFISDSRMRECLEVFCEWHGYNSQTHTHTRTVHMQSEEIAKEKIDLPNVSSKPAHPWNVDQKKDLF